MKHRIQRPVREFTTVTNTVLRDERLSIEARGMFALLMSFDPEWEFRMSHIERVSGCGRDKRQRIMRELIEHGYIKWQERRDKSGRIVGRDLVLFDQPPEPEKPCAGKAGPGEHGPLRRVYSKEDLRKNISPTNSPRGMSFEGDLHWSKRPITEDPFDEFWKAYPHRYVNPRGQDSAKKAWNKAISAGADCRELIYLARAYAHTPDAANGWSRSPAKWLKDMANPDERARFTEGMAS